MYKNNNKSNNTNTKLQPTNTNMYTNNTNNNNHQQPTHHNLPPTAASIAAGNAPGASHSLAAGSHSLSAAAAASSNVAAAPTAASIVASGGGGGAGGAASNAFHARSISRCIRIAPDEKRFAQFTTEQGRMLMDIKMKTSTKIEVTISKDGALHFIIFGRDSNIDAAIQLILNDFQTPVTLTVSVPKAIHGRLLGPKGVRLGTIQGETQTKITMPRKDDDSDIVRVVGLKSKAEKAIQSIQKYVKEFSEKTVERVNVERIYLLFITGPYNENLKRWESMGVKVSTSGNFLPNTNSNNNSSNNNSNNHKDWHTNNNNSTNNNNKENNNHNTNHNHQQQQQNDNGRLPDEITFTMTGEMQAVNEVKAEILRIYEDRKKKCTTVNIEVKKVQHKYILGPNGQNLRNLFAKTGVSVELPTERESETITLRGELTKLGPALSELYSQAHSEMDAYIECENWIHKYLTGARKTNNIDFKARGVFVRSFDDKIKLHGTPVEVEAIKEQLEKELSAIKSTTTTKNIKVESRIHGVIIGKQGATVEQIRVESGAYILVPSADEHSSEYITLEGTPEAIKLAEEKINAIAKKYEASKKLAINQQLQGSIIGRGGEKIREIREKFSQVVFTFPEPNSNCNEIAISGPNEEVEACYNYLNEFHKQLLEINQQEKVPIGSDIVKFIPDAQQAIKRIKSEHKVKVDIYINNNEVKPSALKKEVKVSESDPSTTAKTNKQQEHNLVQSSTTTTDSEKAAKQAVKGSKASKKQQQQPVKSTNNQQQLSSKENSNAPRAIRNNNGTNNAAKSGNNISGDTENYAIVTGRKEDVEVAKVKLTKLFEELATTTEFELKMPQKLFNQDKIHRQLLDEFNHKVVINFISSEKKAKQQNQQPNNILSSKELGGDEPQKPGSNNKNINGLTSKEGTNNTTKAPATNKVDQHIIVKIRGPKNLAKKAEKRFETLMSENYQAVVSVPGPILDKFIPTDRTKVTKLKEAHNVKVMMPDKKTPMRTVRIVGPEKNVQAALQQFNKLIKTVEERVEEKIEIASHFHPRLIGSGGKSVRKIMDEFKVEVKFASQDHPNPNLVILYGKAKDVEAAKNHMFKQTHQLLATMKKSGTNNNTDQSNSEQMPELNSSGATMAD